MVTSYTPVDDGILVEEVALKAERILLPLQDRPLGTKVCKVLAVGPGLVSQHTGQRLPMPVKPGDHIFAVVSAGDRWEHDGVKYWQLWSCRGDIKGIVEIG